MDIELRYFSCKEGHAVSRFGTGTFIACRRMKIDQGWCYVWNEEEVVAIPKVEIIRYLKEYTRVLKDGALIERTKQDYDSWVKNQEDKSKGEAEPADSSEDKQNSVGGSSIPKRTKRKAGKK